MTPPSLFRRLQKRESRLAAASGGIARAARCAAPGFSAGAPWACPLASALARLEARVGLADHEDLATTADHLAVAVTGLRRLQGGQHLHDKPRNGKLGVKTRS